MPEKKERQKIKLNNVRLSFPSLFKTEVFGDEDTGKYAATFILDKKEHAASIKEVQAQMAAMIKDQLKAKIPADKLCLKDGDDADFEGYHGKMTLKASTKRRPLVIGRNKAPLTEDDGIIFAGCYVNSIVSLWAQDNKYGKRINAVLEGVQFFANGEPFGEAGIDVDEFEDYETADMEVPF